MVMPKKRSLNDNDGIEGRKRKSMLYLHVSGIQHLDPTLLSNVKGSAHEKKQLYYTVFETDDLDNLLISAIE